MQHTDDLGELLEALDMEAWLDSQAIDYRTGRGSSGRQLNLRSCPVCGNDAWKVYLNAETGLGNCFAGSHPQGEGFNKWKFVRAYLGDASGRQVVDHIKVFAEQNGWRAKRKTTAAVEKPPELEIPLSYPLPFNGQNLQYLENRGIDAATAAYFHLRYCHEGWFNYTFEGQRKGQKYDQRILIPVFDLDGKMVTFQGRDITGQRSPKYLFPPGLAATGTQLYNGQNVKDTKRIAIGEGAFDVFALKIALDADQALRDVVPTGTFGKHLSWGEGDTQEAKFRRLRAQGVEEAVFFWDGELSATTAAVDAGLRLVKAGLRVRVAMLPKDKDPNEVPASEVRRAFYEAVPLTTVSAIAIQMKRRQMNAR
jgi:DNA primase